MNQKLRRLKLKLREEIAKILAKESIEIKIAMVKDEINDQKIIDIYKDLDIIESFKPNNIDVELTYTITDLLYNYEKKLLNDILQRVKEIMRDYDFKENEYSIDINEWVEALEHKEYDLPFYYYTRCIIIHIGKHKMMIPLYNVLSYHLDEAGIPVYMVVKTARIRKRDIKGLMDDIKKELFKLI